MNLGDQILDDPSLEFPLKPWMIVNHKGFVLCLQCPIHKTGRYGEEYYLALRPKRSSRRTAVKWIRDHRRCGFKGLR